MRRLLPVWVGVCLLALTLPAAGAARSLLFGVADDAPKWAAQPAPLIAKGRALGVGPWRMTLQWWPGKKALTASDQDAFDRVEAARPRPRVVLNVLGRRGSDMPRSDGQRRQMCQFVLSALKRWPGIHDVNIGNEVNKRLFWNPVSPAGYARTLAICYDLLHQGGRQVNLITSLGPRATSQGDLSPYDFIVALGRSYRASHRPRPLFDTFGQNVYGPSPFESPLARHPGGTISIGDYAKLTRALSLAFAGTRQPLPSARHRSIWYLELGFQTSITVAKAPLYHGQENSRVLPPLSSNGQAKSQSQASQLEKEIHTAYCQPAVGAVLNFELADDSALAGWQSGLYWADWTPKPSLAPLKTYLGWLRAGRLRC
jgi:hypothetical protein